MSAAGGARALAFDDFITNLERLLSACADAEEAAGQGGHARPRGHPREARQETSRQREMATSFSTREGAKNDAPDDSMTLRERPNRFWVAR